MLGGLSICLRKRDPSAHMMIHILFVVTLQLQSQSTLICLVNVTLTTKSTQHTSQFARHTTTMYYIAVELEILEQTQEPITETILIPNGSSG